MLCPNCNTEMEEKVIFTSIDYICKHCSQAGWQSVDEIRNLLSPMDFPIKLKFTDVNGNTGSVFAGDMTYFDRCPKGRLFKVLGTYDPYDYS